jgi:hypothetical protein
VHTLEYTVPLMMGSAQVLKPGGCGAECDSRNSQ